MRTLTSNQLDESRLQKQQSNQPVENQTNKNNYGESRLLFQHGHFGNSRLGY